MFNLANKLVKLFFIYNLVNEYNFIEIVIYIPIFKISNSWFDGKQVVLCNLTQNFEKSKKSQFFYMDVQV